MAKFVIGSQRSGDHHYLVVLRALAALAGTAFILVALLYSTYMGYTDVDPPEVAPPLESFAVDEAGRTVSWGASQLTRDGELWLLRLAGRPEQIGDGHGRLAGRLLTEVDTEVRERIERRFGSWIEAWTAGMLLRWDYRGADRFFSAGARDELAAMAQAVPQLQSDRMSAYHRLFLYQCFHGLTQRLDDAVLEGTMFAATDRRREHNLIVGRTLNIDLGRQLELDRVLFVVHPDGRYPFVSVGWAGLTGVVTGINARGIVVALNAARTDDPLQDGAPLPLVLREVLEQADTLETAIEHLRKANVRTSGIVLVADGVQRKSAIVEVGARRRDDHRLARGEEDAVVWATNHMILDNFEGDLQNDWIRRYTSSDYRFERLGELLRGRGRLEPAAALEILRDRRGLGGAPLGLGNRNALDSLATAHSVVIDATAMVLWVGEGPSNLGRYRAFDVLDLLGRDEGRPATPRQDLAPDGLLFSEDYRDYEEALEAVEYARNLLHTGQVERAQWSAMVALALAPDVGELHRLLGDIERELGNVDQALVHYRRYLELVPGRHRDQLRVEGIIAELEA